MACPFNFKFHQCPPGGIAELLRQVALADAVRGHLVLGEVDPSLGVVDVGVLPEIDELQRGADGIGLRQL
ncbi:hypothetical protein D3C83_65310 [compost metagenome]